MYARIFARISSLSMGAAASTVISRSPQCWPRAWISRPRAESRSTVQFRRDDVQAAEHGDDVGNQVVLDRDREHLEMDKRRRPRAGAPGGLAAVGHEVIAQ